MRRLFVSRRDWEGSFGIRQFDIMLISYNEDPYANEFGIKTSDKLASVEARVLPASLLKYHETGRDCLPQVGQWNMMNKVLLLIARSFCYELSQGCELSGMEFNLDPVIPIYNAWPKNVEKALKHVYHISMNRTKGQELDLLLAILPDNNGSLYGDLKRICETELMGGRNTVLMDAISCRIPLSVDRSSTDKSGNILPGYNVIWDESNFSADGIQFPPGYYAHLAAFRTRFYLEPETHENKSSSNSSGVSHGSKVGWSRKECGVCPLPDLKENVKRVMFYC
ncbi:hypothetical protein ACFE04_004756 [Oxalis oulophora]